MEKLLIKNEIIDRKIEDYPPVSVLDLNTYLSRMSILTAKYVG